MSRDEHRAMAEQLVAGVNVQIAAADPSILDEAGVLASLQLALQMAQIHATLATGSPS